MFVIGGMIGVNTIVERRGLAFAHPRLVGSGATFSTYIEFTRSIIPFPLLTSIYSFSVRSVGII